MKKVNTISGALRCAKEYLWDGTGGWDSYAHNLYKQVYICDSIKRAYRAEKITHKASIAAVKLVMSRLAPEVSVGSWLHFNVGYKIKYGNRHNAYHRQIQAYRHRWLDALIIEYSSRGD